MENRTEIPMLMNELKNIVEKEKECRKRHLYYMNKKDALILQIMEQMMKGNQHIQERSSEISGVLEWLLPKITEVGENVTDGFNQWDKKWELLEAYVHTRERKARQCGGSIEKYGNRTEELKREMDYETEKAFMLFERYKNWTGEEKVQLSKVLDNSFLHFITSSSGEGIVQYIYSGLGDLVWNERDNEGISVVNDLIDFCIEARNRQGDVLQRQNVKIGDSYSGASHRKRRDSQSVGTVKRVLLQETKGVSGGVLKGCEAFVEIE